MKLPRRQFLHLAAGTAALLAVARIARAQTYPSRPVRIVVGFPAGGKSDIVARVLGQWLAERVGQQFVIENRPGAGSNLATEAVVRATPDGYTLLLIGGANTINATLFDKLSFDFLRDIAPVASVFETPLVVEVNPSVPVHTIQEFIKGLFGLMTSSSWLGAASTAAGNCSPGCLAHSCPRRGHIEGARCSELHVHTSIKYNASPRGSRPPSDSAGRPSCRPILRPQRVPTSEPDCVPG
jgi:tripartite tricarboxylate transporter family receptor